MTQKLLFVCLGNICRSPAAEGVFLHLLKEQGLSNHFVVDSAGTGSWHVGNKADPRMRAAAERRGIHLPSRARQIELDDLSRFDLVVTMDSPQTAEHVVATARQYWPELLIYARARDRAHAARLVDRGASHVIPETIEASLQIGEMVLMGVGVPDEAARRIIEARRQAEQVTVDESR